MPSERFLNLPEEKRERIMAAAVAELSSVPVDELSINRVVRAAGIPRGSFYQYFTGKDDLLQYILREYREMMDAHIRRLLAECEGDLFQVFTAILGCTIEFGTRQGNRALFRNVFAHLRLNEDAGSWAFEYKKNELLRRFRGELNTSRLRYRGKEDIETLFDTMMLLFRHALTRVFGSEEDHVAAQRRFERQVEMLKTGAWCAAGEEETR